jgi:hypothetical protein
MWVISGLWLAAGGLVAMAALGNAGQSPWAIVIALAVLLPGACGMIVTSKCRYRRWARAATLIIAYLDALALVILLAFMASHVGTRDLLGGRQLVSTGFAAMIVLGIGFHSWAIYHLTVGYAADTAMGLEEIPMATAVPPSPPPLPPQYGRPTEHR